MIPRNSNLDPDPPEFPPRSRVPRWLMLVGMTTMIGVLGMGYLSLRVVQRIRQFKRLTAEIQTGYQALDSEFPFTTPALHASPPPDRIEAYVRARNSFEPLIAPSVEKRARELLANGDAATITDIAQLYGTFYEFLDQGTDAHLAALRDEGMSASEFFWIHGYVLTSLLKAPESDSRRQQLISTLDALEQSSAPLAARSRKFKAESFRKELERQYADYPEVAFGELTGYDLKGRTMACLDIIGATPRLHRGLGLKIASPVREGNPETAALTASGPGGQNATHGTTTRANL